MKAPLKLSAKKILKRAKRQAHVLRDVPRDQLLSRFVELGEQIRQESVSKGTSIDGDWTGD